MTIRDVGKIIGNWLAVGAGELKYDDAQVDLIQKALDQSVLALTEMYGKDEQTQAMMEVAKRFKLAIEFHKIEDPTTEQFHAWCDAE